MKVLTSLLASLYSHYRDYHAYGPPRLKYMGYLGVVLLVLLYFVRFTRPNPQLFDDIVPRTIAIAMLALLALQDRWPSRLRPYYIGYSYLVLVACLPFFTILVSLQRGGGMPSVSNTFIMLCFLVLLTDWRNTLVMLAVGIGAAAGVYTLTAPQPRIPMDLVAQLPAYAFIVLGGNLFKFSTEQIDAERRLRATQALAGSLAHELRYPLTQLKHSLDGVQNALPAPGSAAGASLAPGEMDRLYGHLAQGELAVRRGLQVISMTLDEVSARPVDTADFSYLCAGEATRKAVDEYAYDSEDARGRVSVEVRRDFTFRGDETAYLFVLFNLIKNALYYVALKPDLHVSIVVDAQQVRVRDTGPGIAPEVLSGLFEPFRSVGKSGGTGLGLAYCQRTMRAFGGDVLCASDPGHFTEFTLSFPALPAGEAEAYRAAVAEQGQRAWAGKRILLVEDDAAQRISTRRKLRSLDAVVEESADGRHALDLLMRRRFDVVLLDLHMPLLDGYAVADAIRRQPGPNHDVPIVAYTSEPAHLASRKARMAGMDGFVAKPCTESALVRALQTALGNRAYRGRGTAGALSGRRVLLADDSPYNRKAVAAYLKSAGAFVVEADHGLSVLEHLRAHEGFDAVLLDINMPGLSGLETARAVRRSGQPWSRVPLVALTAHSDSPAVEAARDAGMNAFLVKPVEAEVLCETLLPLLSGTGQEPAALRAVSPQPACGESLLNLERLESYRRLGLLEELMADYLPEIGRLVGELEQAVEREDWPGSRELLHSLLGISGEAGALALYLYVRKLYVPMVENRAWPAAGGWIHQVRALADRTGQALREHSARRPANVTLTQES